MNPNNLNYYNPNNYNPDNLGYVGMPPTNNGIPGIYQQPIRPSQVIDRTQYVVPLENVPIAQSNDTVIVKDMHDVKASKKTRSLVAAVRNSGIGLSGKDFRKIIHVFSPGGKLRIWVMVACLVFLAAELLGFLGIDGALTIGGGSATNHAIVLFAYTAMMFSAAVIACCFFAVLSKEDGTIICAIVLGATFFVGSSVLQGFMLWETASLTASGCTGAYYPGSLLNIFCTNFNPSTGNSYVTNPSIVWTESDARASIIDTTLCNNRSYLWAALFINCSLYAIHLGLLIAAVWYSYSLKVSLSDAIEQMWGDGISVSKNDEDTA